MFFQFRSQKDPLKVCDTTRIMYFSSADVILCFDHRTYSQITYEPKDGVPSNKVFQQKLGALDRDSMDFPKSSGQKRTYGLEGSSIANHSQIGSIYDSYTVCTVYIDIGCTESCDP